MLTSSGARWRPVITGIARRNVAHSQKTRSFGVAVSRPYPTIARDATEERVQPVLTSRTTFRNYGTSPQSLQLLVEESKYNEANAMLLELQSRRIQVRPHPAFLEAIRNMLSQEVLGPKDHEVLELWLELLPDVRSSTSVLSGGLMDDLRRHTTANPVFTVLAGRAFARKGYRTLVEDGILPVARNSLEFDNFVSFERELSQSLADSVAHVPSVGSISSNTPEVFENASEDYASIMATSAPPPPSVIEIVEATLPQMLPPPDPVGSFVFEDAIDEDYAIYQHDIVHPPRQSPVDQLYQLVGNERHDDAFHLLTELQHLHTQIPSSSIFGTAALAALRKPLSEEYPPEEQLKLFTTWFSFIPPIHETKDANNLQVIQQVIMQASITNLSLIMRFCTILARKGYAYLVGRQELAVVMRFAPSSAVQTHIQELESAYSDYWNTYQPKRAASKMVNFSGRVRSDAVRYLAYSGKVEDALALIPKRGSQIKLSAYTYDKLLRTLRDCNNPIYTASIRHIEFLQEKVVGVGPQAKMRQMFAEVEDTTMASELHTASASVQTGTLPETLRYLKRALRRAEDNPHPFVIAEFLERYLATGRTRAPTLLLNLATRSSYHSTSIFLFAEMLYYRRLGQHQLVIQTFINHFYISGVPRGDVLSIYNSIPTDTTSTPYTPYSEDYGSPTRICNFYPDIHLPRGKAWPMKIHCNLVWHTLVDLTPDDHELENLYSKLLDLAQGRDALRSAPHLTPLTPLLPPPSWGRRVDHAAFTPFMRRLMSSTGASRGSRIINDMMGIGIQPSVYHFTELAGYYAKIGKVEPAMILLDTLESSSGLLERLKIQCHENEDNTRGPGSSSPSTPLPSDSGEDSEHEPNQMYSLPEPDLAFYTSIMRGFIISKSILGFELVHKRLLSLRKLLPKKRFDKDQEAILSEVYADFRVLSRKQGYDRKRQPKVG